VISRELFRYGYYEARMKVPPGGGWHTSFWMMKYNRPATDTVAIELDVIENDSVTPLKYGVNVHRHLPTPHVTFGNKFLTTPSLSEDFHVFGCEFTPATIRYFFDGTLVQTVDATLLEHNDMNIWLTSIAAPLGGTTSVDDSMLPAVAQFDYVRYYEPFPAPSVNITSPASSAVTLPDASSLLHLEASATQQSGTPEVFWSCAEGPGSVAFSDPASLQTSAAFSEPGHYVLLCTATNEGGTVTDRLDIGVAAPTTMVLRERVRGYQHAATLIRGDHPDWNAGARDQLIVGRNSNPIRSVLSFDLSPLMPGAVIHDAVLDFLTVGGLGTVGSLQLRELAATPVEGIGIADGSTGSNIGTGSGVTWTTRTGGQSGPDLWANPGGDYSTGVLSETAGFDATVAGRAVTLPSTPAFVSAAQSAFDAARPLDLILNSDNELASTQGYVRLASDDDMTESSRPALKIDFSGNALPTPDPGSAPAAKTGIVVALNGSAGGGSQTLWRTVSGPAAVVGITNPESPVTEAVFPEPGVYQMSLSSTNELGTVERRLAVEVVSPDPGFFADWQALTWPGANDPAVTGADRDPDADGLCNLLEWALHLDPAKPDVFAAALQHGGSGLQYTYTRRKTAPGQANYRVEWSSTLGDDWTGEGITGEPPVSLSDTLESVTVVLPEALQERCFLRLRVSHP
jgi:hypothetical protein